mmetsp:Transcript_47121/g.91955  ORF Transcript_47121/g.91955 Transcript_47121/m.91955 type:complete len:377 (-) Transcript_47121:716-1846(-)
MCSAISYRHCGLPGEMLILLKFSFCLRLERDTNLIFFLNSEFLYCFPGIESLVLKFLFGPSLLFKTFIFLFQPNLFFLLPWGAFFLYQVLLNPCLLRNTKFIFLLCSCPFHHFLAVVPVVFQFFRRPCSLFKNPFFLLHPGIFSRHLDIPVLFCYFIFSPCLFGETLFSLFHSSLFSCLPMGASVFITLRFSSCFLKISSRYLLLWTPLFLIRSVVLLDLLSAAPFLQRNAADATSCKNRSRILDQTATVFARSFRPCHRIVGLHTFSLLPTAFHRRGQIDDTGDIATFGSTLRRCVLIAAPDPGQRTAEVPPLRVLNLIFSRCTRDHPCLCTPAPHFPRRRRREHRNRRRGPRRRTPVATPRDVVVVGCLFTVRR